VNLPFLRVRLALGTALVLLNAAAPAELHAWGSGHDDIMRAVIERLPIGLRDRLTPVMIDEAVKHASHYPDSFDPFLPGEIGEAGVAALASAGMKVRYDLHSERGMAMTFILLVEAIRGHDHAEVTAFARTWKTGAQAYPHLAAEATLQRYAGTAGIPAARPVLIGATASPPKVKTRPKAAPKTKAKSKRAAGRRSRR
jgi:hypothetical protein